MRFSILNCTSLLLLISATMVFSVASARQPAQIATPSNAELAWVSDNVNQNGMQLSIQTFNSPDSVSSVLSFYRSKWAKPGDIPGFVENEMGEWQVISQLRDDYNIVLQIKP